MPILALLIVLSCIVPASAQTVDSEIPVESYNYWEQAGGSSRKEVYSKPTHTVETIISAQTLGINELTSLTDICADKNGNIYLLDGEMSRIVVVDKNYKFVKEITSVMKDGAPLTFTKASNVYVHTDNTIYICDTQNERVLICDINGQVIDILTRPTSTIVPANFRYLPVSLTVDSDGYIYVLCDGSYYGAILYTPEREFMGFYGSNKVKNTITQAFQTMMSRLFVNNTKKGATASVLPYCFVDLVAGPEDFIYTATGYTDVGGATGQIKKLSPGDGSNIIKSDSVNFTDEGSNWSYYPGQMLRQNIVSIAVDENGYIYCLDKGYGRVFIYDEECRMLSAFGGGIDQGIQKGLFKQADAIALLGSDVLVSDGVKLTVTVFNETEFCTDLKTARLQTLNGDYAESKELWESIIKQDSNCQAAYNGLARAYLDEGDYETALEYAKIGFDRDTYELAFVKVRTQFIDDNFVWLIIVAVLLIVGLITYMVISTKRSVSVVKNERIKLMFQTLVHPFNTFEKIKDKNQGSLIAGVVLIVIHYIVTVLSDLCGGFAFTYVDIANYNSLWVFVRSIGVVVLWIVANKLVTTLMNGKGKTFDIFIVTSYSLIPTIIGNIAYIIFSNVLTSDEAAFLTIFQSAMLVYSLMLLVIGTIKIHDYSFGEFLGTTILSVAGMAIVVFLIIMVFILFQQFTAFISTLYLEIV